MASRQRKKWEKTKAPAAAGAAASPVTAEAPQPASQPGFWHRHGRYLALLWVCALIPYLNSFRSGLVFDNSLAIAADTRIHNATWDAVKLIFKTDYWYGFSTAGLYRPLTTLSYLFNYAVLGNGINPFGYHVFNYLLQAMNVALVYFLGLAIFEESAAACAMTALWTVHPLLTESITNIVGRSDQFAAFGVLAGLLLHIRAGRTAGAARLKALGALALAVAVGMFSKESAIVALAAMLLYDLAFPAQGGWRTRRWGYVAAAVPILLFLYARQQVFAHAATPDFSPLDNPLVGSNFWLARLTAVKVIGKYLWLFIWPARLSADYSYNQVPVAADWQAFAALVICCAAAIGALVCFRRLADARSQAEQPAPPSGTARPVPTCAWLFFFITFFFATLAPTANIVILIGTIMAERFMYLPSIALAGCLAIGIFAAARRLAPAKSQLAGAVAVAAIALAFSARTFTRNFDWENESTLWSASLGSAPNSFKVHLSVARAELDLPKPDLDRAVAESERSLAIIAGLPDDRNSPRPYQTAGEAYRRKGDSLSGAAQRTAWYRKALDVLLRGKTIDLANKQAAIERNRARGVQVVIAGWEPLYLELGEVYMRLGDFDKAQEALEYGLSIKPASAFFQALATVHRFKHDDHAAETTLMEGLVIDPSVTNFASALVDLYTKSDPQSCAVRRNGAAASLDIACPLVHDQLCTAARNVAVLYSHSARRPDAVKTVRTAVQEMGCPAELFR